MLSKLRFAVMLVTANRDMLRYDGPKKEELGK